MAKKVLYLGNGKWCWTETCKVHAATITSKNDYIEARKNGDQAALIAATQSLLSTKEGQLSYKVLKVAELEAKLGRKPTLGLDLDNTTGDFNQGLRTYMGETMKIDKEAWLTKFPQPDEYAMWKATSAWFTDRDDFITKFQAAEAAGLYRAIPIFENAVETLKELKNYGFNIKVITARGIDWNSDTRQWLKDHKVPISGVLNLGMDKHKAQGIDLYIDDAPEVISKLVENQKKVVIMDQLYNRKISHENARRTDKWSEDLVDAVFDLLDERKADKA